MGTIFTGFISCFLIVVFGVAVVIFCVVEFLSVAVVIVTMDGTDFCVDFLVDVVFVVVSKVVIGEVIILTCVALIALEFVVEVLFKTGVVSAIRGCRNQANFLNNSLDVCHNSPLISLWTIINVHSSINLMLGIFRIGRPKIFKFCLPR